MSSGVIILLVIIVIFIIAVVCYNGLVTERNNAKNAWSQIDVQLQRRVDLIPNLVETVKGYISHEENVLTKITELRSSWSNAKTVSEKAQLENSFGQSLKTIIALAENYPDLKANENFVALQLELENTENKIATSRIQYNDAVTVYNRKIEIIPTNIIAKIFNFKKEELFKIDLEEMKNNVKINF